MTPQAEAERNVGRVCLNRERLVYLFDVASDGPISGGLVPFGALLSKSSRQVKRLSDPIFDIITAR
jgi:hypothetical protein